ncbi:putative ATP synthase subunit f, mitochondrial [Paramacrobiotus metropolitanus]|uniref:putative ATP synthase subunit f, mitochondrial n=1 Tax=Paramacrobiotus metropolitanus TaxID=2943436 RepID=UPI002445E0BC|nr:putative ATP synthase subunit f, mitochondrial [Paramacrobiotus metropolitanus]XP_055341696.1 putative ATP synthase subunit f, mitochondrial [Paramacrobiotus metropolitanus]
MFEKFSYFGIGEYPPEYVRKVHGPYDPSRYYGKPDMPLAQVKLSELPAWFGRRSFHPFAIGRALSRAYWRWQRKYIHVRYGTAAPLLQFVVAVSAFSYLLTYKSLRHHNHAKYH